MHQTSFCRYMFVEDVYGVDFHRILLEKLFSQNLLNGCRPAIYRFPSKKCNQSLSRKVRARLLDCSNWKIVFVLDSEYRDRDIASRDIIDHFNKEELKNMRLVVIHPMHEAWLCIGLGGKRNACRNNPIEEIMKITNRYYTKPELSRLVNRVNIRLLLSEQDFIEYIEVVKWLMA